MSQVDTIAATLEPAPAASRTALVTGAAVGLGRAIAHALAQSGFDLVIADKSLGDLDAVREELDAYEVTTLPVVLDLRLEDSIRSGFEEALGAGNVDLLVNNAGVALHKPVIDLGWSDWDVVMDVNLKGAFFLSAAFARHLMGEKREGSIVNVGSTHGLVGIADRAVYGISKAGVMHMTKMLAVEWASKGIRVNAIAPGTVLTPSRSQLLSDPQARQRMLDRIPLGRFPTAEEIAASVVYLASPAAASITGHTLVLDGGTTIA